MKEDMATCRAIDSGAKGKEMCDEDVVEVTERGVQMNRACAFLNATEYAELFMEEPNNKATNITTMPDDDGGEEKVWFFRIDGSENNQALAKYRTGSYFTKKTIRHQVLHMPTSKHRFARQAPKTIKHHLKKAGITNTARDDVPSLRQEREKHYDAEKGEAPKDRLHLIGLTGIIGLIGLIGRP